VKVRCIIADAPARQWLKGVKPHTGYYSCERCKIKGAMIKLQKKPTTKGDTQPDDEIPAGVTKSGGKQPDQQVVTADPTTWVTQRGMKFASLNDPPRCDKEWESYLDVEPSEIPDANGKIDERMKHRLRITPIDKLSLAGIKPIASFPLEEMHLVDGGGFKDNVRVLCKLPKEWKKLSKRKRPTVIANRIKKKSAAPPKTLKEHDDRLIKTKDLVALNCRIAVWSGYCTPLEFRRRCRTLVSFKYWKMAESRQFVMYYLIPLFLTLGLSFDKIEFTIIANLVRAYGLITGNSYEKVTRPDRILSRRLFRDYFVLISRLSKKICTYKVHCMWKHLVDDAKRFGCHTTALSAYPFENQVRFFRQVSCVQFLTTTVVVIGKYNSQK
jgi:hypothetical protein